MVFQAMSAATDYLSYHSVLGSLNDLVLTSLISWQGFLAAKTRRFGMTRTKADLSSRAGRQFLDHRQHQLAIAVVQVAGVAAELGEELHFVFRPLRKIFAVFGRRVVAIGEEVRQRNVHCRSDFRERVQRWDRVPVLYARQIAAQQPSTFFDIALRHALLQAIIANRLTDIHCGFSLGAAFWGASR